LLPRDVVSMYALCPHLPASAHRPFRTRFKFQSLQHLRLVLVLLRRLHYVCTSAFGDSIPLQYSGKRMWRYLQTLLVRALYHVPGRTRGCNEGTRQEESGSTAGACGLQEGGRNELQCALRNIWISVLHRMDCVYVSGGCSFRY